MNNTINISIGGTEQTLWHVMDTDSPHDYDGFGTFAVSQFGRLRVVLIRSEHYDWQTSRYASGFHSCNPTRLSMEEVGQLLWRRLLGK